MSHPPISSSAHLLVEVGEVLLERVQGDRTATSHHGWLCSPRTAQRAWMRGHTVAKIQPIFCSPGLSPGKVLLILKVILT